MKTLIALLLTITTTVASAQTQQKQQAPKQNRNSQMDAGPIAGGGGYVCTNSRVVLKNASQQLAVQLKNAADVVFANLPQGWTRERLVQVVEAVRIDDKTPKKSDDTELRFDYDRANFRFIRALKPFCYTYEATSVDFEEEVALNIKYKQIQLEMLHEIGHLMKIGITKETDSQARAFAKEVLNRLTNHFIVCDFTNTEEITEPLTERVFYPDGSPSNVTYYPIPQTYAFANLTQRLVSIEEPQFSILNIPRLRTNPEANLKAYSFLSRQLQRRRYSENSEHNNTSIKQYQAFYAAYAPEEPGERGYQIDYSTEDVDMKSTTREYVGRLYTWNKKDNFTSHIVYGLCKVLAQPISFNFVKAGGAK